MAISCGIIVTIGLPFLLLAEPLVLKKFHKILNEGNALKIERYMKKHNCLGNIKLRIVKLQDCYKDQYRWFAAYYLICRLVIMLITYFANDDYNNMIYYLQTACVVIAMTHIWIQPYKNDILNVIDTTILLIMLLIVNLSGFNFSTSAVAGVTISLVIAPMLLLVGMAVVRLLKHPLAIRVKKMRNAVIKLQQNHQRNVCW